jgi:chromosome segregation ATPase
MASEQDEGGAPKAAGDNGAAGEDNNNPTASTTWAQAREASTHMVLQSALEDLETRASKHQEELLRTRERAAEAERAHATSQAKVEELQRALLAKTEALDRLRVEHEAESAKTRILQESSTATEERMDRLQAESDKLREEIRYVRRVVAMSGSVAPLDDDSTMRCIYPKS